MKDFILTLIVAFVFFKVVRSFVFRNVNDAFQQNQNRQNNENTRPQGDIIIEDVNKSPNKNNNNDGDYVDYEEIKINLYDLTSQLSDKQI